MESNDSMPEWQSLTWVNFGDLHIEGQYDDNYLDFLDMVNDVNTYLAPTIDFAFLPGDNAEDGIQPQYELVRNGLDRLNVPVHIITGDHDRKAGTLDLFQQYLEPRLYRSHTFGRFHLLFMNAMDAPSPKEFDFGSDQMQWLVSELNSARTAQLRPLLFMHLYPSELITQGATVNSLIHDFNVETVEMGHTHYNELANNGKTIYAVTRSTGQIEEGPPGLAVTTIDNDVVSWKFNEQGRWPFVMITSPADSRLITRASSPRHVVRGTIEIRAQAWSDLPIQSVSCRVDNGPLQKMEQNGQFWQLSFDSTEWVEGMHRITVRACDRRTKLAVDQITVLIDQAGRYDPPARSIIDFENAIGCWPAKCILGTQLGPNENGTKGPWPSWRDRRRCIDDRPARD